MGILEEKIMINKNTEQVFLIGFCGKIGSGKSYIASNIVKYLRIKFPEVRVEKNVIC